MGTLLAEMSGSVWMWVGGAVGVVVLIGIIMALPDIIRYIRIKSM